MREEALFITRLASKTDAFVVGGDFTPEHIRNILTVDEDNYIFRHVGSEPLICKLGDIVYYGHDRGEGPYLIKLDPSDYRIDNGHVYERQPIYHAALVTDILPDFLRDIDIKRSGDHWVLKSSRLHIVVHFGDYWIRDIDLNHRYQIPVVSVLERDGQSFEKYWRCHEDGDLIEILSDFDSRFNSAPSI